MDKDFSFFEFANELKKENSCLDVPSYDELRKGFFLIFNSGFNYAQCDNSSFVYRLHERMINLSKIVQQKFEDQERKTHDY